MEYRGGYEQANACQSYWQGNPYSDFYNGNPRNEPDFSWMRNDVRNPPYQHPYQSTYQQPYHPPFQPTYRDPYQSTYQPPGFQMPHFPQPPPYNPPQPNDDLAELKVLMQQMLASQISFQKEMDAQLTQPAASENCKEYSYTRSSITSTGRVNNPVLENITLLDRVKSYPVEFPSSRLETLPLDRATCRASHTRSSFEKTDRVNAPESPNSENSNVKVITSKPEAKIVIRLPFPNRLHQAKVEQKPIRKQDDNVIEALICLDSRVDEVDDHIEMVDVLEADLYEEEPTRGQGETVSEVVHISEAIEVMTSKMQSEAIEVNNLEQKLSPSDLNINMLHDNEDCFIIGNSTLSEHHPLEKGHFFCIQGQGKLKPTMLGAVKEEGRPDVARKEASPEKNGTRRGTKRCWDPGGSFDKIRLVPWAWRRDFGNRFGGANGRGMQDDYDDPGDEQALTHSVH